MMVENRKEKQNEKDNKFGYGNPFGFEFGN